MIAQSKQAMVLLLAMGMTFALGWFMRGDLIYGSMFNDMAGSHTAGMMLPLKIKKADGGNND